MILKQGMRVRIKSREAFEELPNVKKLNNIASPYEVIGWPKVFINEMCDRFSNIYVIIYVTDNSIRFDGKSFYHPFEMIEEVINEN